jgi:PucR C-terminal helix-turn-helix domain/GGDEF-like domain
MSPATEMGDELTAWIAEFVRTERNPEMVEAWVDRTTAAIERGMPSLREDALLERDVRLAVEEHWRAFLEELHQPTGEFHLVPSAVQLAVSCAQRQLPLEDLLKFYRLAQQDTWDYVTGIVMAVPANRLDHAELLVRFWGLAAWWIDSAMGRSIEHFHEERQRIERGAAARRLALVETVLAGEEVPLGELTSGLGGYPIPGIHTALAIHCTNFQAAESLEPVGRAAARALGASQPLLVRPGGRELWVWICTARDPRLEDLSAALADQDRTGVTVVAGTPQEGLEGFRASHREARAAQQLLVRYDVRSPLVHYADVEMLVLVGSDEDAARRFTRRVLGELGADTDGAARLRETVLALLRAGGSVEHAARDLVVHKNTVRYRMAKVEETLGRSVNERPGELETALRYHRMVVSGRL